MSRKFTAIAATFISLTLAAPAAAIDSTSEITNGGSAAEDLAPGTSVMLTTDAAVVTPGTSEQVITQMFDIDAGGVRAREVWVQGTGWITEPDITVPEGYAVEYFVNGSWQSVVPAFDEESYTYPDIAGVRASGSVTIDAYGDGMERISRFAEAKPGRVDGFQGSSGGDGWDVFFGTGPAKDLVFNIYHHSNGSLGIDCHERRKGASCWGGSYIVTGSYQSSARSTGFYVEASDSVYTFISSGGALGMACFTDVSTATPRKCDTFFIPLTDNVGAGYTSAGTALKVGEKIYARGSLNGANLLCFDTTTEAACAENPIDIGSPLSTTSFGGNYLVAYDDQIFFNTYYKLGCYDISEAALCSTFNGGTTLTATAYGPLFYTEDTDGALTGVCAWGAQDCWGLDGQPMADPAGLTWTDFSGNDGWGSTYSWGDRLYYAAGDTAQCYSFATASLCEGFTGVAQGNYMYAFAADPYNPKCMWSNSDAGKIKTFDPYTGEAPCGQTQVVYFNYPDTIPRLSCSEEGNVSAYYNMVLNAPDGLDLSDARITVLDSDNVIIPGWEEVSVDPNDGSLDLSGLTVLESGLHPTFKVEFIGATDAGGTSGVFTYDAAAPQVCTNFKVPTNPCPDKIGSGVGDFPLTPAAVALNSTVATTTNGNTITEETSASADRQTVLARHCLTAVSGYVRMVDELGDPAPGLKVHLYDADGNIVATAITGQDGYYRFPDMYAGVYYSGTRDVTSQQREIYVDSYNEFNVLVLTEEQATAQPPSAPQNVTATPGKKSFTVSWTAPADPGDGEILSYTVVASPGGASCTVLAPNTSCVIPGLDPKVKYSFNVVATSTVAAGPSSEGTPSAKPKAVKVLGKVWSRVYFSPLSSKLDKKAKFTLNRMLVGLPKGAKITKVKVVGYVQIDGKDANNLSLSKDRVRFTKQFLQRKGVKAPWQLSGKGILSKTAWARTAAVTVYYEVNP